MTAAREEARTARRDKKRARRRYGMRVDGKGAKLIERMLGKRAKKET